MKKILVTLIIVSTIGILVLVYLPQLRHGAEPDPLNGTPNGHATSTVPERGIATRYMHFASNAQPVSPWVTLSDSGPSVPLNTWLTSIGMRIEPNLIRLLNQHEWKVYRCADADQQHTPAIVLSLTFTLYPNYEGNLYADQLSFLSAWEQTFVSDTQSLLFPNESADPRVQQTSAFQNVTGYEYVNSMRSTAVKTSHSAEHFVGYTFVDDELLIGNDMACLIQVQEHLFDPGEGEYLIIPGQEVDE